MDHQNHSNLLTKASVAELRARIIADLSSLDKPHLPKSGAQNLSQDWWLLGTTGCHLCAVAEQMLKRLQAVEPITYQHVDIADFDEALMMDFATTIPVILTKDKRLDYPFSVIDLQQLL